MTENNNIGRPIILDCTLRDGGYYTNWDFNRELVSVYLNECEKLPIDYLEIGYRSRPMSAYHGEYFYLPESTIKFIRKNSSKKLAVILNEKDVSIEDLEDLLLPIKNYVDLVRLAIDPVNLERAIILAAKIKWLGFKVAFNIMYMSKWHENSKIFEIIGKLDKNVDFVYMVDSYGSVYTHDVIKILANLRNHTSIPIGFHGHNNLELALANTLAAIENKVSIVDATITGMGRGAGNLKMELLLTVLNQKGMAEVDLQSLSVLTNAFSEVQSNYKWGTSLPYMVSGAYSLPQKQVMEWVSKGYYSYESIIQALSNLNQNIVDNRNFPKLSVEERTEVLLIGGGESFIGHLESLKYFIEKRPGMAIIHATGKYVRYLNDIPNDQYVCMAGNEGTRIEKLIQKDSEGIKPKFVLPSFPRSMGTYVPVFLEGQTFELSAVSLFSVAKDSHTVIGLQLALQLNSKSLFLIGYDGYSLNDGTQKSRELYVENEKAFSEFVEKYSIELFSLVPSRYKTLNVNSLYSLI